MKPGSALVFHRLGGWAVSPDPRCQQHTVIDWQARQRQHTVSVPGVSPKLDPFTSCGETCAFDQEQFIACLVMLGKKTKQNKKRKPPEKETLETVKTRDLGQRNIKSSTPVT